MPTVAPVTKKAPVAVSGKTFSRAGITTDKNGRRKFRFTNDAKREAAFERAGCTDIEFFDFDVPQTKEECIVFLTEKGLKED